MAVIFNGKEYAEKVTKSISDKVTELEGKLGRKLKMVTIYNPEDEASRVYTNIKAKKAVEFGIEFVKVRIDLIDLIDLKNKIRSYNQDSKIDGIMIQMPLGTENDKFLIDLIDLNKDVDGMRPESGVVPATVRAVMEILEYSITTLSGPPPSLGGGRGVVLAVGNKGIVGSRLQAELKCEGMDKEDFNPKRLKDADVIISATGVTSLIHGDMVKPGAIAIDVGYPKGDFDPSTALVASFFTPVPGGVGPVTVAMLFANLVDLVISQTPGFPSKLTELDP